ncbi:MAG TPA: HD domain-containing protein [Syntrophomonadaceae bacterium]|nr:HD domain-containing protein [Syntrophomonadaceae bacterium]
MRLLKRTDLLINDSLYNEYLQRNAREEMEPRFCRHDISHHFDVALITFILILENNDLEYFLKESGISSRMAAKEVIYAAGLLHDIGKWKEYRDGDEHASYSAKLARGLLPRALFNPDEIEIICRAIYEHRNISNDMSFLGERLYRANNLSRICSQCGYNRQCPKVKQKEISVDLNAY